MVNWGQSEHSIVVVEDPLVGRLVGSVLGRQGYQIHEASAEAALDLLGLSGSSERIIVTNQPEHFLPFAGRVRLLYLAACPDYDLAKQFQVCRVLRKPFHPDELLSSVVKLLATGN